MFSDKPFKLGNIVHSPIYGVEGVATLYYHHSKDRESQVLIQPISTDPTKPVDAHYIDINLVDFKAEGFVDRLVPLTHNPFTYGDKIRDKVSGLTGVVTGWLEMMNGCIDVKLTPDYLDKDGKYIESLFFEVTRVEKVDAVGDREVYSTNELPDDLAEDILKAKAPKSLRRKIVDALNPETHTTDPAKRPGPAMHRGENIRRS